MDRVISTPSCSYCIWNRYCQNHRRILPKLLSLYDLIQLNSIACRVQTARCTMMQFRWSIPLSIDYVWNLGIDRAISTPSCSYCVWNRYGQNHRSILPNFLLFAWFDTVEFKRLPCSNTKMYDDIVFDDRFRYQLTMFEVCVLLWQSLLLDTHIAYEIVIYKSPLVPGIMRETISHAGL